MSLASPHFSPRPSVRSLTSRLLGQRRHRRDVGAIVDRNTSPTDFVLRDYRHVR